MIQRQLETSLFVKYLLCLQVYEVSVETADYKLKQLKDFDTLRFLALRNG